MKRVVVTGLGIVSPIGNSLDESWSNVIRGNSGIGMVTQITLSNDGVRIGGEVKDFDAGLYMSDKEARRSQRFVQFENQRSFFWDIVHPTLLGVTIIAALGVAAYTFAGPRCIRSHRVMGLSCHTIGYYTTCSPVPQDVCDEWEAR